MEYKLQLVWNILQTRACSFRVKWGKERRRRFWSWVKFYSLCIFAKGCLLLVVLLLMQSIYIHLIFYTPLQALSVFISFIIWWMTSYFIFPTELMQILVTYHFGYCTHKNNVICFKYPKSCDILPASIWQLYLYNIFFLMAKISIYKRNCYLNGNYGSTSCPYYLRHYLNYSLGAGCTH